MTGTHETQAVKHARRELKRAEKYVAKTEADLAYFRALKHESGIEIHESERRRAYDRLHGWRGALTLLEQGEDDAD